MEQTAGRDYILSALKRQRMDRVPTTVLIGPYCSRLARYSIREILTDARKSATAHLAFYDRFKPDSLIIYNDIYLEAEAIGSELDFPENAISHPKKLLLDNKSHLTRLRVPNPKKDGRIPYFIEVCERVSSQVSEAASIGLGHSGPWNIAVHLRGAESLLLDTFSDPAFVHELMKYCTQVVRTVGDALIEAGFSPSLGEAQHHAVLSPLKSIMNLSNLIIKNFVVIFDQKSGLCHFTSAVKSIRSWKTFSKPEFISSALMQVRRCKN